MSEKLSDRLEALAVEAGYEGLPDDQNTLREAAAALRAVEGDGWLPIESAPKDGRLFLCWVAAERWSAEDGGGSGRGADTSDFDFGRWQSMDDHPEGGYYENMMGQIGDAQDITHWQPLEPPRLVPLDAAGSAEGVEGG